MATYHVAAERLPLISGEDTMRLCIIATILVVRTLIIYDSTQLRMLSEFDGGLCDTRNFAELRPFVVRVAPPCWLPAGSPCWLLAPPAGSWLLLSPGQTLEFLHGSNWKR